MKKNKYKKHRKIDEMPIYACAERPADHKMYGKCTKINRACDDYLLYHSFKYFKSVV